jgi:hypothetical protein
LSVMSKEDRFEPSKGPGGLGGLNFLTLYP